MIAGWLAPVLNLLRLGAGVVLPPVADFTASPLSGTAPLAVQFTDESTNNPTSWAWTAIGQNTSTIYTSTLQDPIITFTVADVYDVELAATNTGGTGTKTRVGYITVNRLPEPARPATWTAGSGTGWNDAPAKTPPGWTVEDVP